MRTAMMAITTSNSISVKARLRSLARERESISASKRVESAQISGKNAYFSSMLCSWVVSDVTV